MSKHVLVTDAAAPPHFAVWALFKKHIQPGDVKCEENDLKKQNKKDSENVIDCDRVGRGRRNVVQTVV